MPRNILQHFLPLPRWFHILGPILLLLLLVYELTCATELDSCWQRFCAQLSEANACWLLLAVGLMPFNWIAEMKKWHPLVQMFEPMSSRTALQAVLAGVSVSLFTPNRIGEFAGRLYFVRPENRSKAMMATMVGNMAQILVLLSAGVIGASWILRQGDLVAPAYVCFFAFLAGAGLALLLLLYLEFGKVLRFVGKIPALQGIKRFLKEGRFLEQFCRPALLRILQWAAFRYLIYATQYFCLLKYFGIQTALLEAYAGIATLFLLQTCIPLPPLAGLVARGNLAIFVWAQLGANELSSLSATFALWIINLILPALVGTFSILYVNIAKTFVYENDQH